MANPTWITSENVKFNGTLENAAVLETVSNVRSLILWDDLSAYDQTILTDFIAQHGDALPLAGPTSGQQTVDFNGTVIAGDATGLSAIATATAGYATVDLGDAKQLSDSSGLSSSSGTHGMQVANFMPTISGSTPTDFVPTAGHQTVNFSVVKIVTDSTGLVADVPATSGKSTLAFTGNPVTPTTVVGLAAANYDFKIAIDGAATAVYTVAAVAGDTMENLATLMTAVLTGSTVTAVANELVITSSLTGSTSAIIVTEPATGANTDLFAAIDTALTVLHTTTPVSGTDVVVTTYTASISVDGVTKPISIIGSAAQTFTTLLSEINTDLGASAIATLVGGNIVITSATFGTTSTIAITAGTLFPTLTNYGSIATTIPGTKSNVALTSTININGVAKYISILPINITTFADVINEINTDLGASAVASISGGDIKITSATFGTTSTVSITVGTLFPALPGFINILPPQNGGGTSRTYGATVIIDGTIKTVSFTGLQGNTIQDVLDEINTDLGVSATATLTDGNIVITSATTGLLSTVKIHDSGFLFDSLLGYVGISNVQGTAPTTYTATITVDGVAKPISIIGSAAQTFTTLLSEINTDLGASAVASISGGNIKITSATTGLASTVAILDTTLFKALGVRGFIAPVDGITNLVTAAKNTRSPNGTTIFERFDVLYVGAKPPVPPYTPHSVKFTYWDGSVWKYLDNDATV
jgi:hypothetical protein